MSRSDVSNADETYQVSKRKQYQLRLKTFAEWKGEISAEKLAMAGFSYTGMSDQVICRVCNLRISNLVSDADPLSLHRKYDPSCSFVVNHSLNAHSAQKTFLYNVPEYSDYHVRLQSFVSWPLTWVAHTPEMMARSGFFYTGSADRVMCFSCGVELRDWDQENPAEVHRRYSEGCEFADQLDVDGIKQEIEELKKLMLEYDDYNFTEMFDGNSTPQITFTDGGLRCDISNEELSSTGAGSEEDHSIESYPRYADLQTRLESFSAWPLTWVAHTPEMMARSGFFYTGSADRVRCFSCGIECRGWAEDDNPADVHRKKSKDCEFVAHLDIESITRDITELEKLLVEFDDYNFTEIFDPYVVVERKFKAESLTTTTGTTDVTEGNSGRTNTNNNYPQYAFQQERLDTFTAWPLTTVAHTPEMLARSGFFYIGSADRVLCFSCGLEWRDWNEEENPADVHRINSEDCEFVAQLDDESIKRDIEELEKLMVEFDDYNFTEIHDRRSTAPSVCSEHDCSCSIHKSNFVGCCPT